MPGSIQHLFLDGSLVDIVKSPRVGMHVVSSTGKVYERLFDAQVAAEKGTEWMK